MSSSNFPRYHFQSDNLLFPRFQQDLSGELIYTPGAFALKMLSLSKWSVASVLAVVCTSWFFMHFFYPFHFNELENVEVKGMQVVRFSFFPLYWMKQTQSYLAARANH